MTADLIANILICGKLAQETIINLEKKVFIDQIGGNLLYTAYGSALWRAGLGLAARVGEDFPQEFIQQFKSDIFNTSAIHRSTTPLDLRAFYAFEDEGDCRQDNPQKYFYDLGLSFPKNLLGYALPSFKLDNRRSVTGTSLREDDIPADLLGCQFLYLCPLDFLTHSLLPPLFRMNSASTVVINPAPGYMHSSFWYDVPAIFRGSLAVITTEKRALSLFLGRSRDIWEMCETIASFGVELVLITAGKDGQYLYERAGRKKYHLPAYPVKVVDTIGANDAFGGGFLAGYSLHFDPLQAALMGNISASIKVEGSTPRQLAQALPELISARLEHFRDQVNVC